MMAVCQSLKRLQKTSLVESSIQDFLSTVNDLVREAEATSGNKVSILIMGQVNEETRATIRKLRDSDASREYLVAGCGVSKGGEALDIRLIEIESLTNTLVFSLSQDGWASMTDMLRANPQVESLGGDFGTQDTLRLGALRFSMFA